MPSMKNIQQEVERSGEKTLWFEILPTLAATVATRTSELQRNTKALGVMIEVITANKANAASFTPKILVPDGAGGSDVVIATYTAINANGTNILIAYPGGGTDEGNQHKDVALPREWKFELTSTGNGTTDAMDTHVYIRYI